MGIQILPSYENSGYGCPPNWPLLEGGKIWSPSENAEQREMIKDKLLRQQSIGYSGGYNSLERYFWFTIFTRIGANIDTRDIKSESEAFLQAVEQLIDSLCPICGKRIKNNICPDCTKELCSPYDSSGS
jgi:hypothetical protein